MHLDFKRDPVKPRPSVMTSLLAAASGLLAACHVNYWEGRPSAWWGFLFLAALWTFIAVIPINTLMNSSMSDEIRDMPRRRRVRLSLISIAACLGLMVVVPTLPLIDWDQLKPTHEARLALRLYLCVFGCQLILFPWLIRIVLLRLTNPPPGTQVAPSVSRLAVAGYALPCILAWNIYHLAFWPAIMNCDAADQWVQLHLMQFDDWHPPIYELSYWPITLIWDSPAALVTVQIVVLAFSLAWGLVLLRRAGLSRRGAWVLGAVLALSPLNAAWAVCTAKDTPFSIVMLLLTLLIFEAVLTRGKSLGKLSRMIALLVLLPPGMLYRHNGVVPCTLLLIGLACVYREYARRLIIVALCAGAMYGGVKFWLYPSLNVTPTMIRMQPVIHLLAAHVDAGTPLSPEEKEILIRVHPLEDRWHYDAYRSDGTLFAPDFRFSKYTVYPSQLPSIAWRLTLRNPWVTINHFWTSTTYLWRMAPPERDVPFVYQQLFMLWDDGNQMRYMDTAPPLVEEPLFPYLTHAVWHNFRVIREYPVARLIWSPALRFYGLIACVVIWCVRVGDWRGLLVLVPAVANELSLALGAGGQVSFRLHLPIHFIAYLFVGLLFVQRGVTAVEPKPKQ